MNFLGRLWSWLRNRPVTIDLTHEEGRRLRDWEQAQSQGRSDLERVGHTGFLDLGQDVLWHSESGLSRDYGSYKVPIAAFEAFAIFGGSQSLIDALTDQVERITSESGDVAHS